MTKGIVLGQYEYETNMNVSLRVNPKTQTLSLYLIYTIDSFEIGRSIPQRKLIARFSIKNKKLIFAPLKYYNQKTQTINYRVEQNYFIMKMLDQVKQIVTPKSSTQESRPKTKVNLRVKKTLDISKLPIDPTTGMLMPYPTS